MAFLIKCKCQHCNQSIEFDSQHAGQTIACPNCGMETMLFAPAPLPSLPKPVAAVTEKKPQSTTLLEWLTVFLMVISFGLIFVGCAGDLEESASHDGSAIRQAVYAVQYGSGFLLFGLCLLINGVIKVIRK